MGEELSPILAMSLMTDLLLIYAEHGNGKSEKVLEKQHIQP